MSGLVPVCERCRELRDDCLVLITADGLVFEGEATEIEGSSVFTGGARENQVHRVRF